MPEEPSESPGQKQSEPHPSRARSEPEPEGRSRTAIAGRAFLAAARADIANLIKALQSRLRRSRKKHDTTPAGDETEPQAPSTRSYVLRLISGLAVLSLLGGLVVSGTMFWALHDLPLDEAEASQPARTVVLEAANGSALGRIGSLKSAHAPLQEFPAKLEQAVLSIEDKRFYSHFGVDPKSIARALYRNVSAGTIVEGASTITQQLVRLQFLNNEQTYTRKLREAFAAIWLEMRLSKDEILARYLNNVYLGAGSYGMPAAARLYFNKKPADLTLSESALLAGLIKAPSRYNPFGDLEAARERAGMVLDVMVEDKVISEEEARRAREHPASLNIPEEISPAGTWFADWVSREALDITSAFDGSVRVRTHWCPNCNALANRSFKTRLPSMANAECHRRRSSPCVRTAPLSPWWAAAITARAASTARSRQNASPDRRSNCLSTWPPCGTVLPLTTGSMAAPWRSMAGSRKISEIANTDG
jgi:membrane peptidoglycan carboxypeptidase